MALTRPRQLVALLATLLAIAAIMAAPAWATAIRVEGPKRNVFQGPVVPYVGSLKDQDGVSHTTRKQTALGALVRASRTKPFPIRLEWSDAFGGAWNGFYLTAVNGVTPPVTAFWAVKVDMRLTDVGLGAATVTPSSRVLVYYTTFDPTTFATKPTLGIAASPATIETGGSVAIRVSQFDDTGAATPAVNAWVWVRGVGVRTNANGLASVRLGEPGTYRVRATKDGTIRSKTLWVRAR